MRGKWGIYAKLFDIVILDDMVLSGNSKFPATLFTINRGEGRIASMSTSGSQPRETVGQVAELRSILMSKREELTGMIRSVKKNVRDSCVSDRTQGVRDQVEASQSVAAEDIRLAFIQMQGGELQQIDAAIQRLENGTFGYCEDCNEEIAVERLKARLFATRCLSCAEELQKSAGRIWPRNRSIL